MRGDISHVREEHLLLLHHVLREIAGQPVERCANVLQLGMALAMHLDELIEMTGNQRNRQPKILVVRVENVIDQRRQRRVRHVVSLFSRWRERLQRRAYGVGIDSGVAAGLDDGSTTAATEINAELFENGGSTEVGGDDLADGTLRK